MEQISQACFIEVVLLVALCGHSVGQSEVAGPAGKTSECVVDVDQFARTSRTSPEVIRLQSELIDPDVPVTPQLILELAHKSVGDIGVPRAQPPTTTPEQTRIASFYGRYLDELTGKYLDILLEALSQKRGQAQIESLATVVQSQFLRLAPMHRGVQDCFQRVAASIFPSLPFETQWLTLHSDSYPLFKSANLTAYLRQLYESLEDHIRDSEPEETERDLRFYRSMILQRIYEEDPIAGRAMIIEEITSGRPRVDIEALAILPDETLPEIDRTLLRQLPTLNKNSDDYETMAELGVVERYGTESLLPGLKSSYLKGAGKWNSRQEALFLSYFLRTNPQFARQAIVKHLKERKSWYYEIFADVTDIRVSPELGKIARDYIDDRDRLIAGGAVNAFNRSGEADVETLLWKNLDTWHKKWSQNSDSIPFDEQSYQDSLVEALLYGGGPCKSKDAIDRLRPIYIKGNSVDGNIEFPEWHDPIRILADISFPTGPRFQVDFCGGLLSLEQLKTVMPRFPKATDFEWNGMHVLASDVALDPLFKELEALATEHGMSLRPRQDQ
jgi:hypothetical protein